LTGTTTIVAKPGMGDKLMEMVATMPGESCLLTNVKNVKLLTTAVSHGSTHGYCKNPGKPWWHRPRP
jgi:hypothetical protein